MPAFLLAQAASDNPLASLFGGQNSMFFLVAIFFAIFYFMIIRPQQKQQKDHNAYLAGLKKGDEIITTGGIIGKIDKVVDGTYLVEIASNVKVRVVKGQVSGPFVNKPDQGSAAPQVEEKK